MITTCYSNYQLDAERFNNLFTDKVGINTLNSLGQSAADGNLDCIDMLHNLALRNDDVGKKAETILFDLFSGKTKAKIGIDEEIQQASLKLFETACGAKDKNNQDMKKLYFPSKLLYIAGSAVENAAQKKDISNILQRMSIPQEASERFENSNLWCNGRMLMSDEIDSAMESLISNNDNVTVNYPIGLINPTSKENTLSQQIFDKITHYSDAFEKTEIFPINVGDHWVLFTLVQDKTSNNRECVVFNSFNELKQEATEAIIDSAEIAEVKSENIKFISTNLQENVPNGCGLFVVKVAELISNSSESKPVDTINNFINEFAKLSAEDQSLYNIQNRRQLYELHIAKMNRSAEAS